ncbi:MAG: hypothetical protein ACM3YO_06060 [Bacteroidota bacterium]
MIERLNNFRRLAIVGTAKNVGKTTTLNWLLERFEERNETLAITSVGRDGEPVDMVTERPKPRIVPPVGTLVATARATVARSEARLEKVFSTPFRTALGPVDIYRVLSRGKVEVAGPVAAYQAAELASMLSEQVTRVLIDGAIDRRASAAISDGIVLATGMALDPDPEEVFRQTLAHCQMLSLPSLPDLPAKAGFLQGEHFTPWEGTALDRVDWTIPAGADTILLGGALTEGLAQKILAHAPLRVVVPNGTHLVMGPPLFEKMEERGIRFFARTPMQLAAVTLNPTSPHDDGAIPEAFLARMRALPVPVFDLCLEKGTQHATAP